MKTCNVSAQIEHLDEILSIVDDVLFPTECTAWMKMKIQVSVEEIFTNIVSYAYGPDGGTVEFSCWVEPESCDSEHTQVLRLCFKDHGIPYNPLEQPKPEFHLPLEERPVGGLGIYMVRQFMDEVEYRYEDSCNLLILRKKLS